MSMASKRRRKRARKACTPCRQRKRKCDGGFPCDTCTIYEYNCNYADDDTKSDGPSAVNRISLESGNVSQSPSCPAKLERSPHGADGPLVCDDSTPPGIFDVQKSRYAGASAVMAFPHVLSGILGSDSPTKMKSLAYNFGIRPEEAPDKHVWLGTIISEDDLESFSDVHFSALAPIGDFLDRGLYAQRCRDYYSGYDGTMIAFGAVAAGVAALGSFLSPDRHPRESDLVQYAKAILDDPASMRTLGIDHIVAWAMRVFYLRATSRPNNAWIASCTMMHLCEAVGLHEDENIKKLASHSGAAAVGHDADRLRRIFWISWAGHNLLSYEYDRSAVRFRAITCQAITPRPNSVADQFVHMIQIIPSPNSPFHLEFQASNARDELFERLRSLRKLEFTHPFLVVTRADIAFCFYRRIFQLKLGILDQIIEVVTDIGNAAVDAAQKLASEGRLFWNVIGSVFQYICVLLAMDTTAASVHIPSAFKGLENLVKAGDTRLTREALAMARHLLSLHVERKRKDLSRLEAVEAGYQAFQLPPDPEANVTLPDMDWEQFLIEPSLSMFGPDI